jgi:hypothetical protein
MTHWSNKIICFRLDGVSSPGMHLQPILESERERRACSGWLGRNTGCFGVLHALDVLYSQVTSSEMVVVPSDHLV